jgi:uncharacterized protein with beta-barrel porin domain
MKRSLFFTDTPRTALGNVDGNQYFALLRNGVDLPIERFGVFTPFVALEMQSVESPAFIESGADSDFTVHGSGPARDMAQVGLGARVELGRQIHAFLRYDGEFGGSGHTHAGSVGVDYQW